MRRIVVTSLVVGLLAVAAAPATAHPALPVSPTAPTDVTWAATDNVEYLGRFPEHSGTAGGRVLGDRFYLTDPRGVYVYDTSTPEAPALLGALPLPQSSTGAALAQEDPDTDGNILLVDAVDPANPTDGYALQVVDVSDPSDMSVIGTAPVTDHTWTCVTTPDGRCSYAYGRSGYIVDLTDPTGPVVLDTSWRTHVGLNGDGAAGFTNTPYTHDLTEVRTGRVMSAGKHNVLMDTTDPTAPRRLANIETNFHMFGYHSVEWANDGHDDLLVAGTEIAPDGTTNLAGSDCQGEGSWISTYDTSEVRKADHAYTRSGGRATSKYDRAEFVHRDDYHVEEAGLFLDGNAPGHTLYCAHWMELAPSFADGGRMVAGYYDWGTRFVDVAADGTMTEIGWFTPAEGYTGSAQWVTDEVVYVMDYRRGLEVLRLSGEEATGVVTNGADVIAAGAVVEPLALDDHGPSPALLALAAGVLLGSVGLGRRRARSVRAVGSRQWRAGGGWQDSHA